MEEVLKEQTNSRNSERIHRVGSITAGMSMIIWGVLFVLYEIHVIANLELILKLWPLILIGLGVELLWFNARDKKMIYDRGAIVLMFLMAGFSMMMAIADVCMRHINVM